MCKRRLGDFAINYRYGAWRCLVAVLIKHAENEMPASRTPEKCSYGG
jgi:hypothetical protein